MYLMIIMIGIIVSLDGLAAAFAYGVRKIYLTPLAVLMVSLASAVMMGSSMGVGRLISRFLPPIVAEYLGALLLLVLGCYLLYQQGRPNRPRQAATNNSSGERPVVQFNLKAFGLVVQILRDPTVADVDQSGAITWQESFLLGLALSLDSFGVGIGAAMTGLTPGLTAFLAGLVTLISLLLGWELGYNLQHKMSTQWQRLPGLILILLGIANLFMLR